MEAFRNILRRIIPRGLLTLLLPWYHLSLAWGAYWWYGKPAQKLFIVGITGTKGKSSTVEILNAIFEEAGFTTAIAGTIRFKIDTENRPNLFKMTMPGRGFIQKFLREAVTKKCTHAVLEVTSEGAKLYRHKGLELNALIFTNIAPEHIESHGSYENYKRAKLSIGEELMASSKRPRIMVANTASELGNDFLMFPVERALPYTLQEAEPYTATSTETTFTWRGKKIQTPLHGAFNIENCLAAMTLAEEMGIEATVIARALERIAPIQGRVERIKSDGAFEVVVDYAHTPDSLEALYTSFSENKKICVLGNTGGGRDTWKRPKMAQIAEKYCDEIILTNEDPYDEDPRSIVDDMAAGMKDKKPAIILDRREALAYALRRGRALGENALVLVTGKGTDPFIMGPRGTRTPWSDTRVVKEELEKLEQHGNV